MILPSELYAGGRPLDLSPEAFGELRSSADIKDDYSVLSQRLLEDGYVFVPGFFDRGSILDIRKSLSDQLAADGSLDPDFPTLDAISRKDLEMGFRPDIANGNQVLESLIYGLQLVTWFEGLLGGPIRHYDFSWLRAVAPGLGTSPHCDIVYMGRGTTNLCTAWIPMGDVPLHVGGLIILEGSNKLYDLRNTYGKLDVDVFCENAPDARNQVEARGFHESGAIDTDPVALREKLGGRWLTAEYKMGDLLVFGMFTIHASLDNRSREIRFSSDSRYQLASDPVDERWVGENPIGHGPNAKRSLIC